MIFCDTCKKGFEYNYLLRNHLLRKIPCKPPVTCVQSKNTREPLKQQSEPLKQQSEPLKQQSSKCRYCHKYISRAGRLQNHERLCKLKEDAVRKLEIRLNKKVSLDPESRRCRFCDITLFNVNSLRRHDALCKHKEQYRLVLLSEFPPIPVTIQNITFNTTINNTIDWNDSKSMRELLERLLTPEQIQRMTRTGDVAISLGNIARVYYSHTDSVVCTNLRSNMMRCRENGTIVSHNADYVSYHNIEPIIHRVQDTDELGHKIPNIDDYNMLDQLTRVPVPDLTKNQKIFLKSVMDEQKNASYDAFRNRVTLYQD